MKKPCRPSHPAFLLALSFALLPLALLAAKPALPELADHFAHPPDTARPWVYWFWLNGNINSNGVTADLEAMKRAGIGGVLIMEVNQGTPKGPADFGKENWRELFKHVCAEAHRLGLQVNMNNDAGWCGSGGPWITPDLAMQKLVFSRTNITGPLRFEGTLPHPEIKSNYYGEIALLAFPTPKDTTLIDAINWKAAFTPEIANPVHGFADFPKDAVIVSDSIIDLTGKLDLNGKLNWNVPAGNFTILRIGHTTTGKDNHPAPEPGRGLESDKLSKHATDVMFDGLMGNLIKDSKPLAGNTLVTTHIDSWETGSQNWTPRFRQDFKRLRGYDLWKYLPVMAGHAVDSAEISERFLWDVRQTVSDLLVRNYAGRFRELARRHGLKLSIEAYGSPCDELKYAGQADEPMAEFWSWGYNGAYSCTEMSSAAHIYGKPILGAEAFTASDLERWQSHPGSIKALGDWAFCEGINRFVFHRYAFQPWNNVAPGISMGPWGLHYERTQTWWNESIVWHEYLARCQYLLQQGLFVADLCYLQPEDSPQRFTLLLPGAGGNTPDRSGYNFDGCTAEVVLERMKVEAGRIVLPDGMSYRAMVLAGVDAMTPRLLKKIRELVKDGATVIGPPPSRAPGLSQYVESDAEVRKFAHELWGDAVAPEKLTERAFGKGRVVFGGDLRIGGKPVKIENPVLRAKWVWRDEGDPLTKAPVGTRYFQRAFTLKPSQKIASAQLAITADNSFEVWLNGQSVGTGDNFKELFKFDVKRLLKPGTNIIAVEAVNGSDKPNPAGLIGSLRIRFFNGPDLEIKTDRKWLCREKVEGEWKSLAAAQAWDAVRELGGYSSDPWKLLIEASQPYNFPPYQAITNYLAETGLSADFDADAPLRYIHKRIGDLDLYFVANPATNWVSTQSRFRVADKVPELWDPVSGKITVQPVFATERGRLSVPISLEPLGSLFVVFRQSSATESPIIALKQNGRNLLPKRGEAETDSPAIQFTGNAKSPGVLAWSNGSYEVSRANGHSQVIDVHDLPATLALSGAWQVAFEPKRGAPETLTFTNLIDWSKHPDNGVKYFSGHAKYIHTFNAPAAFCGPHTRAALDLGDVAVMARVRLNGKEQGILWKAPYRVDISDALKTGENTLEITVVNTWVNRLIGDEQLPEDSERHANGTVKAWPEWLLKGDRSPTGRFTFTSWKLWKKDSPLQKSGLLGPVQIIAGRTVNLAAAPALAPAGN